MKILIRNTEILAIEGGYTLADGWYAVEHRHFQTADVAEVEVDLPEGFDVRSFAFENGAVVRIPEPRDIPGEIRALESQITVRRQREAILGTDNGWLANIDAQIADLRSQL